MNRVCFHCDESYKPLENGSGMRHVVIAGVALCTDRTDIRRLLLEAESVSRKGAIKDWSKTPRDRRERYLDALWGIPYLVGRVFYVPFDQLRADETWEPRLSTLARAIDKFTLGSGRCDHEIHPEGTTGQQRHAIRRVLLRRGYRNINMKGATFKKYPESRLADALAGYIREELYRGGDERSPLTNLPNWFENLEP
jgi:hypothetical protein